MGVYSLPYGVFIVGRYKKGKRKHDLYVKNKQTGQFVDKKTMNQVLKDVFGKKNMFRLTIGTGISVTQKKFRITYQKFSLTKKTLEKAKEDMVLLVRCRNIDAALTDLWTREDPRETGRRLTEDGDPPKLVKMSSRERERLINQAEEYISWTRVNPDPNESDIEKIDRDETALKKKYEYSEGVYD